MSASHLEALRAEFCANSCPERTWDKRRKAKCRTSSMCTSCRAVGPPGLSGSYAGTPKVQPTVAETIMAFRRERMNALHHEVFGPEAPRRHVAAAYFEYARRQYDAGFGRDLPGHPRRP